MHDGRAAIAPYRQKAGFVEFVAQLRQMRRRQFDHVQSAQGGQPYEQRCATQPVVVGQRILFGETAGHQCLQITMNLAGGHSDMLGQARQGGRRGQFGQCREDVRAYLGGLHFLSTWRRVRVAVCHGFQCPLCRPA